MGLILVLRRALLFTTSQSSIFHMCVNFSLSLKIRLCNLQLRRPPNFHMSAGLYFTLKFKLYRLPVSQRKIKYQFRFGLVRKNKLKSCDPCVL